MEKLRSKKESGDEILLFILLTNQDQKSRNTVPLRDVFKKASGKRRFVWNTFRRGKFVKIFRSITNLYYAEIEVVYIIWKRAFN